jgi:protein tyrosine phosphatase (PTP) superfamily phosphohydrolase (DUF442 family)
MSSAVEFSAKTHQLQTLDLALPQIPCDNKSFAAGSRTRLQPETSLQVRIPVATLRASAALLLAVLATPAFAKPVTSDTAVAAVNIFNFGQVSSTYFRGGELKGSDAADLAKLGVKMVIDLRSDGDYDPSEAKLVGSAGMRYTRIAMTTRTAPTADQIATFLKLTADPANQPVYVHCVEGRHRTGVMTAVYRMNVDKWTADQAFGEMKQYKFGMDFLHPEFKKFVYGYQPAPAASEPVRAASPAIVPAATAELAAAAATN